MTKRTGPHVRICYSRDDLLVKARVWLFGAGKPQKIGGLIVRKECWDDLPFWFWGAEKVEQPESADPERAS